MLAWPLAGGEDGAAEGRTGEDGPGEGGPAGDVAGPAGDVAGPAGEGAAAGATPPEWLAAEHDARISQIIQTSTNRYRLAANAICHDGIGRRDYTSPRKTQYRALRNTVKPGIQRLRTA